MDDDEFSVIVSAEVRRLVVRVRGEVDMATSPTLVQALIALARSGDQPAVVDLSDVTFMDCSGVTALVVARRCGLDVAVVGATGSAAIALAATGFGPDGGEPPDDGHDAGSASARPPGSLERRLVDS